MVLVRVRELELARSVCPLGIVVRRRRQPLGMAQVLRRRHHLVLEAVDPRDEAAEQPRGVAADLVLSKGELVDVLEQDR